jgi:hypothetical protein
LISSKDRSWILFQIAFCNATLSLYLHQQTKLIKIFEPSGDLSFSHLQESCAGNGLRILLASRFWKQASADEKLHYLDWQYHQDFTAIDVDQSARMIRARIRMDRILAAT